MNILVVDDIATNRKLLRVTLEAEGHTTLDASDGLEALKILGGANVDAVISDILMPNMDGFRLCHEIRKSEKLRSLPFIFYTATYTSPTDATLAQSIGADKYLTKPVSTEAMLRAIGEAVGRGRTHAPLVAAAPEEASVLKQYSEALVKKLQDKNADLQQALETIQRAHEQIIELNLGLEQRVRARTSELEATSRDLTRRNQEIQNFYHTLSHELKTPLTSAREFISILLDGLTGLLSETQSEYLTFAQESCDQINRCLDDLLDSTRLETGNFALDLKPCLLGDVVKLVLAGANATAMRKQLRLHATTTVDLPELLLDPHRINQVVTNLVNNAMKFTPSGGAIEILTSDAPDEPGFIQISVGDNGRGIPNDQLERVFERLAQVKSGDAATEQGVGLGLYLCRQLVELHGGRIWAKSEMGKGSVLTFVLPKKYLDAEEAAGSAVHTNGQRKKLEPELLPK